MTDSIRIRAIQLTAARRSSHMAEPDDVDAAIARYLADGAERLRRRTENMTAILLWGAEALPPGGPFPDALKADPDDPRPPVRPAAIPDTGKGSRHRRRAAAAKARH